MLSLNGEPALRHVLRRCKAIGADSVIVAVPDNPRSQPIVTEALRNGVGVTFGPELDVLSRYYAAAFSYDVVMRVTSDCPLLDPELCRQVLSLVLSGRCEYASNVLPRGYPKGLDCEAFTFAALQQAHTNATEPYDREHVTPWLQRNVRAENLGGPCPDGNWCLDTLEDYVYLSGVFSRLPATFDWRRTKEHA